MSQYRDLPLNCKVFVGNLGSRVTKQDIEEAFDRFGPLKDVWVAYNPPGFAFLHFEDPQDADDAVRGLDGTDLCGSRIRVDHGRPRRSNRRGSPSRNRRRYSRSPRRSPCRERSPRRRHGRRNYRSRTRSRSPLRRNSPVASRSRSPRNRSPARNSGRSLDDIPRRDHRRRRSSPRRNVDNSPSVTPRKSLSKASPEMQNEVSSQSPDDIGSPLSTNKSPVQDQKEKSPEPTGTPSHSDKSPINPE